MCTDLFVPWKQQGLQLCTILYSLFEISTLNIKAYNVFNYAISKNYKQSIKDY